MLLIGLDPASRLENFGYAIGALTGGRIEIEDAGMLESRREWNPLKDSIAPRLRSAARALVAVDAPLGWPASLASALAGHRAGERVDGEKAMLFSRETDRIVAEETHKRPLEVGADKIARAAHTALEVLACLRETVNKAIPLAWARDFGDVAVIEVYPAATLKARGLVDSGYKKPDQESVRHKISLGLREEMPALVNFIHERSDVFDACLCLVAAKDFLLSDMLQPKDHDRARREGWIWVRAPQR